MMLKSVSRILMTMLVVLLWQWLAGVTAESAYSRIVAFGDSLADPGNAFTLLQISAVPPFEPIPSAPYARGGHHFSNGATWVEQLGGTLGLLRSGDRGPAVRAAASTFCRIRFLLIFSVSDDPAGLIGRSTSLLAPPVGPEPTEAQYMAVAGRCAYC